MPLNTKHIKIRIINVKTSGQAYDQWDSDDPPPISWMNESGKWSAVIKLDWQNILAEKLLAQYRDIDYEVIQPDEYTDQIREHTFPNGSRHLLFPSTVKHRKTGFKTRKYLFSQEMVNYLEKRINGDRVLINLNGNIYNNHFLMYLINRFRKASLLLTFHGEIRLPVNEIFRPGFNPVKNIHAIKEHLRLKHYYRVIDFITYQSETNLNKLRSYYKKDMEQLTMGIDINFWK